MGKRQALGKWGERTAEAYLVRQGYQVCARNVYTPYGEIDLIVELTSPKPHTIVFVEVKTRTTKLFGPPEEAVNPRKISHLLSAIEYYMQEHPTEANWRLDVIAVERYQPGEEPVITHFENAITG